MRIVKWIIYLIAAAILAAFLFANREVVTVYFDPLGGEQLKPIPAPQYLVLLAALALGVVAGSFNTWLNQGKHRRRAREASREAERLRRDLDAARTAPVLARQA